MGNKLLKICCRTVLSVFQNKNASFNTFIKLTIHCNLFQIRSKYSVCLGIAGVAYNLSESVSLSEKGLQQKIQLKELPISSRCRASQK